MAYDLHEYVCVCLVGVEESGSHSTLYTGMNFFLMLLGEREERREKRSIPHTDFPRSRNSFFPLLHEAIPICSTCKKEVS